MEKQEATKRLTTEERLEEIKGMLEDGRLLSAGDVIYANFGMFDNGQPNVHPAFRFIRKKDNEDVVLLATTEGVDLFPANDLYDLALEKARELSLSRFDSSKRKFKTEENA